PIVHVVFYPDGSTNIPALMRQGSSKSSVEQLFALSIDRFDVRHGELLWNDQRVPLDFAVHDTTLQMSYSFLQGRYDGRLLLGKGVIEFKGKGSWTMEQFETSGGLVLHDLGWQDDQIAFRQASATSDYSVSDQEIKLSKLQGRLCGGSFAGDALIDNWLYSAPL